MTSRRSRRHGAPLAPSCSTRRWPSVAPGAAGQLRPHRTLDAVYAAQQVTTGKLAGARLQQIPASVGVDGAAFGAAALITGPPSVHCSLDHTAAACASRASSRPLLIRCQRQAVRPGWPHLPHPHRGDRGRRGGRLARAAAHREAAWRARLGGDVPRPAMALHGSAWLPRPVTGGAVDGLPGPAIPDRRAYGAHRAGAACAGISSQGILFAQRRCGLPSAEQVGRPGRPRECWVAVKG